jgi:hypothetical protein
MAGFIFGGDTGVQSAAELARRRKLVDALLETGDVMPRTFGEGLSVFGRAIAGKLQDKKLSAKEDAERARAMAEFNGLPGVSGSGSGSGSGGGYSPSGTWTPAPPPPNPTESFMGKPDVAKGGLSYGLPAADTGVATGGLDYGANVMTPQEMLIAGATARGLDPIDVATAISYETGGKFDPLIKGPTTQWGSHEGLIQFGDPQGQEHGAVFDQGADAAWRSQLDPTNGAVWSYLDSVGVKPGMGLDQIYSGINAGGVNRGGASDANNGGAPGTVSDKVASMGPHREKAAAFLGGTWTPADGVTASAANGAAPAMGMDMAQLSELASNPYLPEGQRAVVAALMEAEMSKLQPVDPMDAIALEKAQLELDALKNPNADPLAAIELEKAEIELARLKNPGTEIPKTQAERMALAEAGGLVKGTPEYQQYILTGELTKPAGGSEFGLTPVLGRDKDGNVVVMQLGKDGTAVQTQMPEGVTADLGLGAFEKAKGAAEGKGAGEATGALPGVSSMAALVDQQIQDLKNDPYLPNMLGPVDSRLPNVSEDAARVQGRIDQLQGGAFLQARQMLKGGGAITDIEGQKAEAAFVRMNAAQSMADFIAALDEFNAAVQDGVKKLEAQTGGGAAPVATPPAAKSGVMTFDENGNLIQ